MYLCTANPEYDWTAFRGAYSTRTRVKLKSIQLFPGKYTRRWWSKWSKWSFGHLVKIDFGQTENATIIIKIYFYYYSEQKRTPRKWKWPKWPWPLWPHLFCTNQVFLLNLSKMMWAFLLLNFSILRIADDIKIVKEQQFSLCFCTFSDIIINFVSEINIFAMDALNRIKV